MNVINPPTLCEMVELEGLKEWDLMGSCLLDQYDEWFEKYLDVSAFSVPLSRREKDMKNSGSPSSRGAVSSVRPIVSAVPSGVKQGGSAGEVETMLSLRADWAFEEQLSDMAG